MALYDHIIIGSGINALVCAAILSQGSRVLVLERETVVGGTMRTDQLADGFTYDPLAATFVLFHASPAFGALEKPLARHGATFSKTDRPTGVLTSDGRSLVLKTDRAANAEAFDALHPGDGARYLAEMGGIDRNAELLFGLFNNKLIGWKTARLMARKAVTMGPRGLGTFFAHALTTNRRRLTKTYQSDLVQALFAPWPLHAGLNPEQPFSGQMGAVIAYALEAMGAPVVTGGAARVPEALRAMIESGRGTVRTGADVEAILPGSDGRAVAGVRLEGGEEISCPSIICSVTPTQLYGRLLKNWDLPPAVSEETARYQYGKGNMQIHYALDRPVEWADAALKGVQLLHLTDGVDAVSKASNEAERGMLPARPTVCVGQPSAADPSRAPDGKAVLWIQLPECPTTIKGDAAGTIDTPADGTWTEAVREAYADRVEAMIEAHVPGFRDTVVARKAMSPADVAATNINLVGGDPYAGWCGLDQFFLFRPMPQHTNQKTAVEGVYMIGAATHPGPGLNGTSGFLLANDLKS
ncbi:NAD(P)/FAD-dependent oxidoreductase [Acuticoccus sp. MNP-M23]|uniref:phytoene desaturase family protein n=1 Tax=Acuticoccus sp. MNP-M23 TaxID=3072793 RepID=UPI0028150876|nr:NAD(P)/FAD-dependent oxidoreductase [Acuticoccus sp. MNP-M23]WMS42476.1 NAD(P)/FAD-dependent oxidoreductase [Acuticoccus sp. MNP-M23]